MCLLIACHQSSSFPTASQPTSITTHHQHSDDNVSKRLEYEMGQMSIAEETDTLSSQVCVHDNKIVL